MLVRISKYYKDFHCIAKQCKHTCCKGWEIEIDPVSYEYYKKLHGAFGERVKEAIKTDHRHVFRMVHGKCPFLKKNGLCEMYEQLGEKALCEVCTEFPRTEVAYGQVIEKLLVLSCEEAGRLLFSEKEKLEFEEVNTEEEGEKKTPQITQREQTVIKARNMAIGQLQNRTFPIRERILRFLELGGQVQRELTGGEEEKGEAAVPKSIHELFRCRMDVLTGMEVVEEEWGEVLENVVRAFEAESQAGLYLDISDRFKDYEADHEYEYEHMLVYFASRYLVDAINDGKFLRKVKFCIVCYLAIRDMDRMQYLIHGNTFTLNERVENVRIFCKEVEHSKKSMEYLLEKIESEEVFGNKSLRAQIKE